MPPSISDLELQSGTLKLRSDVAAEPVKLVVAMRRALDRAALATALGRTGGIRLVAAEGSLSDAAAACRDQAADAILLDVSFPEDGAFKTARQLLGQRDVRVAVFLDHAFSPIRGQKALEIAGAGYATRDVDVYGICNGIRALLQSEGKPLWRGMPAPHFFGDVDQLRTRDDFNLLSLTPREYEVLVLLAEGQTVADVAKGLDLTVNTVRAHRARIMMKVGASKSAHLTRAALLGGCIH